MIELLFLLGFSLHNIEEALWLPKWSSRAGRFHSEVKVDEFRFAVIMVTVIGYLITFQYFIWGSSSVWSRMIYLGFILMMALNAFFPHLAATMFLKKYAPGTLTGILLNVPIGGYLVFNGITASHEIPVLLVAAAALTAFFLISIRLFFRAGGKLTT